MMMSIRVVLLAATGATALAGPAGAASPPPGFPGGCRDFGSAAPTADKPTVSLASSTLTLRNKDRVRVRIVVRGNQATQATVSIAQPGGRLVGGTDRGTYTCTFPDSSVVSLPLNSYGRALVRRHRKLSVRLTWQLVNGSGVRNTVRLSGVVRPG